MSQDTGQQKKFNDPLNNKIQKKFDQIFLSSDATSSIQTGELDLLEESMNFNSPSGENKMNQKNSKKEEEPKIDFDFSDEVSDGGTASDDSAKKSEAARATAVIPAPGDSDLGFSIDFNFDDESADAPIVTKATAVSGLIASDGDLDLGEADGFTIEGLEQAVEEEDEDRTRVTEAAFSFKDLNAESNESSSNQEAVEEMNFSLDDSIDDENTFNAEEIDLNEVSTDLTPSFESKKNIESTIRDIVKPKMDSTNEFQLDNVDLDLGRDDNVTKEISIDKMKDSSSTSAKDLFAESFESDDNLFSDPLVNEMAPSDLPPASPINPVQALQAARVKAEENVSLRTQHEPAMSSLSSEDSIRFQSTIRALREEREDLLNQFKTLKSEVKELNQENLTLKANLDEAKIEITILRKRHLVEVEDIKYRLSMSDEKKLMAEEKARQAELKREKLEQKVRIDFNQVKQREKELESKLELLSMDVDSQVHSRDQKILELRRKIDALEFNMENASIKEQKSLEDKRKLEDRLNKIMKTLRHSIKNLEDDITEVDHEDHGKDKN